VGATGKNNTLGWTGYDIVIVFAVAVAVIVIVILGCDGSVDRLYGMI